MGRGDVLGQAYAWKAYDQWLADDRVSLLAEPSGLDREFRLLTKQDAPAPTQWADAYLSAFASVAGLTLVTFDQGFRGKAKNIQLLPK